MKATHRQIRGTARKPLASARRIRKTKDNGRDTVTVVLSPDSRPAHALAIARVAARYGLVCRDHEPTPRAIHLIGTVAQLRKAFQVDFDDYEQEDGTPCRCRTGPYSIPAAFGSNTIAVLGLDTRTQAKALHHIRRRGGAEPRAFAGHLAPLIGTAYDLPASSGTGGSVGIIELGGKYQPKAMQWYFSQAGIARAPNVSRKGRMRPRQRGASIEVMLDAEIIASLVPDARTVVYFGPNTTAGFYNAIARAVAAGHDAVSISWGAPEGYWTEAAMTAYNNLAQQAGVAGVTLTAASGDAGSSDGVSGVEVDFPASAPYILGCGGTEITVDGSTYVSERVWNDDEDEAATGGGFSEFFSRPSYQDAVNIAQNTMRMVPDVAAVGDPSSGYKIRVNGETMNVGGTSAASPLWAALVCRLNVLLGRKLGFCHPALYALAGQLRQITEGDNGAYQAGSPFNLCCGLGTPPSTLLTLLQ